MNKEDLYTTAALAGLSLSEREEETVGAAFEEMLRYFEVMKDIDVEGLEPTTHALVKDNRVRNDEIIRDTVQTDKLLENAPELDDRFITIPSVL
jgi:aspartyl-tRNA(Asn)/glutamyl-tRNA(Gln) amidotransferase subunit C